MSSGPIELKAGEPEGVYSPTDVGTGKAKEEKAPLSEIIQALNDRFGTAFTEEDRLFFAQIKARAAANSQVIQTALANPLEKFPLGVRKLVEDLMIQRMAENDKIVAIHGRQRVPASCVSDLGQRDLRGRACGQESRWNRQLT